MDVEQAVKESNEYLTFSLGDETYGIDILAVKEIRGYESVTKIANAPDFVKGVINLRGDIVPIVDLRIKFHIGAVRYDEFTIVIVLHLHERIVGVVVDSVSDVVALTDESLRPPPEFGVTFNSKYLRGLATVNDEMIILVDIAELIASDELELFDKASIPSALSKEEI